MANKIIVEIEALDYTITERDVIKALRSHFPYMPTRVHEVRAKQSTHWTIAVCAPEYHTSLDEVGDRFCRMCGQPLSQ